MSGCGRGPGGSPPQPDKDPLWVLFRLWLKDVAVKPSLSLDKVVCCLTRITFLKKSVPAHRCPLFRFFCPASVFNSEAVSARYNVIQRLRESPARSFRTSWMLKPRDEVTLVKDSAPGANVPITSAARYPG